MFGLNTHLVKFDGVDLRTETEEGKAPVGAVDIAISTDVQNTVLDEFHPELRESFYKAENPDQPDMLGGTVHMPIPKFPKFPRFPWAGDLEGYTFIAHTGVNEHSEIKMADVKINGIKFKVKDKGMVAMSFIIRAHDNPGDIDKLRKLLGLEVQISLVPPSQAKQFEIEQARKSQKRALEDHFSGGGAQDDPHTRSLIDDGGDGAGQDPEDHGSDDDDDPAAGDGGAGSAEAGDSSDGQKYQVE